jgi:hypothetical protein
MTPSLYVTLVAIGAAEGVAVAGETARARTRKVA